LRQYRLEERILVINGIETPIDEIGVGGGDCFTRDSELGRGYVKSFDESVAENKFF
jgi:hypothetical protein